jgi:hypothetical protein
MPSPLKPLIDAAVPQTTKASPIMDPSGRQIGWQVQAIADVDGALIQLESYDLTLPGAVAQAISQLSAARGLDIVIVHD